MVGGRFVGREPERALLSRELGAALGGEGRLVLLTGEPGIGKTRTAAALAAEARERGAAVAAGRCTEREDAPAYWPVVQALAAWAEGADAVPAEVSSALATLRASEAADAARSRFELFEAVRAALTAAASARPLLVLLDDLHWADAGSLRMLEFLAPELSALPLLVVGTLRDTELPTGPERARLLGGLARLARSVRLDGLARPAVRDLLADRLASAPAEDVVDRVLAVSDGNPFFVIEVAQLLAQNATRSVPPGVQELLRQRLAPLSAHGRRLLEAAAVLGREFALDPLAALLAEEPAELLAALAEPLAAGLLRPVPEALRRYAFSHSLLRDALYEQLAPAARTALHGAAAAALEQSGVLDDERLSALAHHSFEAAHAGDPAQAVRYGCEAGERALRLLAFEEAVRHFERTLAALALGGGDEAVRLRALTGLGEALRGAGDPARADAIFREALALAQREGGETLARTALRFSLARSELGVPDLEMNALLEETLAATPDAPPALRARLMARLAAGLHLQPGAAARRRQLSDDATRIARGLGDPAALGFVLSRRIVGLLGPDDLAERLSATDEILHGGFASRSVELEALVYRIDDLAERGDRAGLDEALAAFERKASASRQPFHLWTAASLRVSLALLEGRFVEAETLAAEALALGRKAQGRTPQLRFAQQLFTLRGWQGRLAEVEPLLNASLAETRVVPGWRCALADFYSLAGRDAEARRELDALAANDFTDVPRDTNWLVSMALLATACGRLRDAPRAALLYELMLPYRDRVAVSRLAVMIGPIELPLGVLAGLLGRVEAAEEHFARALALAERMRALPWQAQTRYEWGALLARPGAAAERERSGALLAEAEAIGRAVGMELLLRWIAALPGAAPAPASRTAAIRRDGEVWTLVFEGRTTQLRDMIGLAHIAKLLGAPGRELAALDLVAAAYAKRREPGATAPAGDAGEQLDARARAAYEERLRDARDELDEAARRNDRGHLERLASEIELLEGELERGFGLGGRARRAGADRERARLSVSRAIRYAIDKLGEHDPALAEHLRRGIRTGAACAYVPSPRDPVRWTA